MARSRSHRQHDLGVPGRNSDLVLRLPGHWSGVIKVDHTIKGSDNKNNPKRGWCAEVGQLISTNVNLEPGYRRAIEAMTAWSGYINRQIMGVGISKGSKVTNCSVLHREEVIRRFSFLLVEMATWIAGGSVRLYIYSL